MKRITTLLAACLLSCGSARSFVDADAGDADLSMQDARIDPGDGGAVCERWVVMTYEPGADGILGTQDDVLGSTRTVEHVGPNNVADRTTSYTSPGPDQNWDTADDVIAYDARIVTTSPADYDYLTFDGPGADGVWGNADDRIWARQSGHIGGSGRLEELRSFSSGPDKVWRTADDQVDHRYVYVYADGTIKPATAEWQYNGPGPDQTWGTNDDALVVVTSRFVDWGMFATGPGVDGIYGTKDDVLTTNNGRYTDVRDMAHVQLLTLYGPGPDNAYFSADDAIQSFAETTCSGGVYDARIHQAPGPDGQWGTADDLLQLRTRITGCGVCGGLPKGPTDPR